ncbi:MAG: hypothetical protein A3J93_00075 [Candidatus Magasanikbacteria bacterium RIFOXYC2_FULL_42_28]|uniref:FunZ protein n=1 Tax=Candidatus Magasanikbacteria bacterium RIFOXYC2_FULL_42_28 TaxID=1798704 RepID=A0A1F6NW28_9BACT|nr:MAG: hypothetical protein A3J93_00075 [Candidatus Magasanikbacteria bacterium RIFOXYC2_FULL_42_28]
MTTDIKNWLPEFQAAAETDAELGNYFFTVPEINQLIISKSWLVLGRKGTGKTAIYKYLETADRDALKGYSVISLNFKDYPWPIHKLYKEVLSGELSAYQKSWKYLFFVKALSKLIEQQEIDGKKLSKDMKWAKNYIEKIYGKPSPTILEVLKSKIVRIDKIKAPGVDMGELSFDLGELSFDKISEDKDLQDKLQSNAFTLLNYFENIFKENVAGYKFMIILDQLDENWLSGEIEEYSKVLINLLNVCRNISTDESINKFLKIVPFMRSDIYHSLRFNDKNKLFQDSAIVISWNNESLDRMFYQRVKKYAPTEFDLNENKKSGVLFEVDFVRQGTPPFHFITRRSFFRPRDIIVYFNKISKIHRINKTGLYTSNELYDAAVEASTNVYGEIIDEWSNQFPEIEKLLGVLQLISVETFKHSDFVTKYRQGFPGATEIDINKHLNFLFDNSIIGQKKQGRWEYICSSPNLKMNIEKSYRTHQALKYRLQLTEGRS